MLTMHKVYSKCTVIIKLYFISSIVFEGPPPRPGELCEGEDSKCSRLYSFYYI